MLRFPARQAIEYEKDERVTGIASGEATLALRVQAAGFGE